MGKEFFAGFYLAAAVVIALYLFRAMAKKDELGQSVTKVLAGGLFVILSYIIYLCTDDYFLMSLSNSLVFVGIDWTLFFLAQFSRIFTSSGKAKNIFRMIPVLLVADNIHLLVNPFREISIGYQVIESDMGNYLFFQPKLLFNIHLLICYLMVLNTVITLGKKYASVAKMYRLRYAIVGVALLAVILFNAIFLLVGGNVDFSIVSYAVAGCFLYSYVYDYKGIAVANATKAYFVEQMKNPMVLFDYEGKMIMSNKRAREILELKKEETLSEFVEKHEYLKLSEDREQEFETTHIYRDKVIYFQIQYKFLKDERERPIGAFFVYNDVTEKKRALIQAEYNATHDILTGIYNRNYLSEFRKHIDEEGLYPVYGVAYNINGLRVINEKYGTEVGNKSLKRLAWLLQQFSRVTDYVIRMDGGEMVLVLPATTERKANEILKKIERRASSFDVDGIHVTVSSSQFCFENIKDFDRVYEEARVDLLRKKNMASTVYSSIEL